MSTPIALVIDDDALLGEAFRMALELSGFEALHVSDSTQAHDEILHHNPDVILLDMQMPILNGEEVLKQLRADEQTKDVRVIVATANPLKISATVRDLADLVLQKPVSLSQVTDFAKRFLALKRNP